MLHRGWTKATVLLLCSFLALSGVALAQVQWEPYGPQVDEIIMPIIKDTEAQLIAIRRGEVHVLPGLIRPTDIETLQADPNVDLTIDLGFHMFYLAFNMRREPLDQAVIRQALAHAIDRESFIQSIFRGYMLPLASFVPPSSPFHNADVPVYEYDPDQARQILDEAGYTLDPASGIRVDPKTGQPLREMKIFTPTAEVAPTSAELGRIIAEAGRSIGLPLTPEPMDFPVMLDKIDIFDFDMYTLAWGLSRNPDYLYSFFHSSQDVEAGYNTPGIRDPALDGYLEKVKYARTYDEAMSAAMEAQEVLSEYEPYVPLYSRPYINAFRTDVVTGYVPMLGYGSAEYTNQWTTLNIRRVDGPGGAIRWLLPEEPKNLNPLVASSTYEWEVLGRLFDGLLQVEPENMEDIPWMARAWNVETWEPEPGKEGTKVTYFLRDDVKWHDGVPFTAADVKFSLEYIRDNKVPRYLDMVQDIVRVETLNEHAVAVYFSTVSYWHLYDGDLPLLAKHIWEGVEDWKAFEPWREAHPTVPGLTKLVGTGPFVFKEYVPGEYVRLVRNEDYFQAKK